MVCTRIDKLPAGPDLRSGLPWVIPNEEYGEPSIQIDGFNEVWFSKDACMHACLLALLACMLHPHRHAVIHGWMETTAANMSS